MSDWVFLKWKKITLHTDITGVNWAFQGCLTENKNIRGQPTKSEQKPKKFKTKVLRALWFKILVFVLLAI